jgi:hypothetical protein
MRIELQKESNKNSKGIILIFTEGTILGPSKWYNHFNHKKYIPIRNAVKIIGRLHSIGWDIHYLTSVKEDKVKHIKETLNKNKFVGSYLHYRGKKEDYKKIAEEIMPKFIIEDDCRSIEGKWQMTYTYLSTEIKKNITQITVKEFGGIDNIIEEYTALTTGST